MFSYEIYEIFKNTFFLQNTSTLMATSRSKQFKPMKTYTESLSCRKKKWYTWTVLLRLVFLDNEYLIWGFPNTVGSTPILVTLHEKARSSRPEVFCKNVFLKFHKPKLFSPEFSEICKNTFFIEHLRWLLPKS